MGGRFVLHNSFCHGREPRIPPLFRRSERNLAAASDLTGPMLNLDLQAGRSENSRRHVQSRSRNGAASRALITKPCVLREREALLRRGTLET